MKFIQKCQYCEKDFPVETSLIGVVILCPHCNERITVQVEKKFDQHPNTPVPEELQITTGPLTGHVTVEKTSKDLKAGMLLGCFGIILGIFIMFASPAAGIAFTALSLVVVIIIKIMIWWNHG